MSSWKDEVNDVLVVSDNRTQECRTRCGTPKIVEQFTPKPKTAFIHYQQNFPIINQRTTDVRAPRNPSMNNESRGTAWKDFDCVLGAGGSNPPSQALLSLVRHD